MAKPRKIRLVPLSEITPRAGADIHRPTVAALSESMSAEGQRQPIVITRLGSVLHGHHRLEAARELGWAEIEAVTEPDVAGKGGIDLRAAQITAENLVRRTLPAAARSREIAKLVESRRQYLAITRESEGVFRQNVEKPSGGRPESDTRQAIKDVADRQEVSERTIERAVKQHSQDALASYAEAPGPDRSAIWVLFERQVAAADKALAAARKALAPLHEPWPGEDRQWQGAARLRSAIGVTRRQLERYKPALDCPWCSGAGGDCGGCEGLGFVSTAVAVQLEAGGEAE